MTITVKVLYFAAARELIGLREETIELSGEETNTTDTLRDTLSKKYPTSAAYINDITLAVNLEYVPVGESRVLYEGDEVAFIPPISGG